MRPDMYEVIIERPRGGAGWKRKRPAPSRLDDEDLPPLGRESTSRRRGGSKYLNENLAPLKRYLRAQLGRPWNKVYSEISAQLCSGNPVQQHVRDHLEDLISLHVEEREGEIFDCVRTWRSPLGRWRETLYVCPRTGLVRLARARPWRRQEAPPRVRWIEGRVFIALHGGWFELTLAPHTMAIALDAVLGPLPADAKVRSDALRGVYGRSDVHASAKRQISGKEARRLGLGQPKESELPPAVRA